MTPYEQGYMRMLKMAGLQKRAVTLDQLRRATKALQERVPIVRRNVKQEDIYSPKLVTTKVRKGSHPSQGAGPMAVLNPQREQEKRYVKQRLATVLGGGLGDDQGDMVRRTVQQAQESAAPLLPTGQTTIYQGGSPAELFADHLAGGLHPDLNAMRKSGPGQEAFNRWVLLHEGAEAGKHYGDRAIASHRSTRPLLHDLNIAATLEGPGQEAAPAIRAIRAPEVEAMAKYVPGLERLNLGEQRISRHAMKRLQEAYERGLERAGVEGIPALNM